MLKRFKCPKCGCNIAEEIVVDATISNEVIGIWGDCGDLEYGACGECFDGYTERYQCQNCGYVIPEVRCPEDMVEWLKENGEDVGGE